MKVTWKKVTPRIAASMLEHNANNRRLNPSTVKKYASDMTAGRWEDNGQSIIMGPDEQLLDGQHRLHALIMAGVTLSFLVVRGVSEAARRTIDLTRARNIADQLRMAGVDNYVQVGTAARHALIMLGGGIPGYTNKNQSGVLSVPELMSFAESNEPLAESVRECAALKHIDSQGFLAAFHFVFGLIDEQKRDAFFKVLRTGLAKNEHHPAYLLRERLIRCRSDKGYNSGHVSHARKSAVIIRAWNAHMKRERLTRLMLPREGLGKTPSIHGIEAAAA